MKKKILYIIIFIIIFVSSIFICNDKRLNTKVITYNGNNLKISIDGVSSSTLPTSGTYYLIDYECSNKNTEVTWDNANYKLNVSNGTKKAGVSCYLEFKSNPLLSEMPVGSYVAYTGDNGCDTTEVNEYTSCEGKNANYVSDTDMGYCFTGYRYAVSGWRIGYIEDGSAYLISAGALDCMCTDSSGNALSSNSNCSSSLSNADIGKHYENMDNVALKYCNSDYIKNGVCNTNAVSSNAVHAMNTSDFQKITGKILSFSSCFSRLSDMSCGYNNDLIDIGGHYWFSGQEDGALYWYANTRRVLNNDLKFSFGVRPVLNLESSVIVTGGNGTYENPYEISNNYFRINGGASYLNASDVLSSIQLDLNAIDDVSKMCISVNTSVCTNYIDYSDTYTLDWSSEADGEKIVYVYYKDSGGNIVATMNRSITIDTTSE